MRKTVVPLPLKVAGLAGMMLKASLCDVGRARCSKGFSGLVGGEQRQRRGRGGRLQARPLNNDWDEDEEINPWLDTFGREDEEVRAALPMGATLPLSERLRDAPASDTQG